MQRKTTSNRPTATGYEPSFVHEHTKHIMAALTAEKANLSFLEKRMMYIAGSEVACLFAHCLVGVPKPIIDGTNHYRLAQLTPMSILILEIIHGTTTFIIQTAKGMCHTPTQEIAFYEVLTKRKELEREIQALEALIFKELIVVSILLSVLMCDFLKIFSDPNITLNPLFLTIALYALQYIQMILSVAFFKIKKYFDNYLDNSTYNQLKKLLMNIFPQEMITEKPKVSDIRRVITFSLSPSSAKDKHLQERLLKLFSAHNITARAIDNVIFEVYMNTNHPLPDIKQLQLDIIKITTTQATKETISPRRSSNPHATPSTASQAETSRSLYGPQKISPRSGKGKAAITIDPVEREPNTEDPCIKIAWKDQRGNPIVYDEANDRCPVKPITGQGIPANRLFMLFPLTVDDFSGDNNAFQKFSILADHASAAKSKLASEGIIFIPDSKKVSPITYSHITFFPRAKIKALGDYGDGRVYCERLTSANGEQLYVARHYKAHTHKRV